MVAVHHLSFWKFLWSTGRDGQIAPPCQLSWRSMEPLLSYKIYQFFKMGAIHYLRFIKMELMTVCTVQRLNVRHCAKFWVDRSNCCWDMVIFRFSKLVAVCHLNLLCACLDHPWRVSGGKTAKFGWNWCSNFNNMQVLIFNEFGFKMHIHAPNWGFWGFYRLSAATSWPQKAPPCAEAHHRTYRSLRLVHLFCTADLFTEYCSAA